MLLEVLRNLFSEGVKRFRGAFRLFGVVLGGREDAQGAYPCIWAHVVLWAGTHTLPMWGSVGLVPLCSARLRVIETFIKAIKKRWQLVCLCGSFARI